MPPANPFLTDNSTFITPLGLAFTGVMGLLVLVLPRRFAPLPILAMVFYMTMGMRLMLGGLNFTMIRVLLVFCWARLIARGELKGVRITELDRALIYFSIASIITHTFLIGSDGLKYKLGQAYDALGYYFFFRFLLKDWETVLQVLRMSAVLLLPLALEMLGERETLTNRFAVFGGVSPAVILRDGTPRAQGPFGHPILAGTFGATFVPFMIAMLITKGARVRAAVGFVGAGLITFCAGSSGPLLAFVFGIVGLATWPLRRHLRWLRWGLSLTVIGLHMVMKAPVWFLLARVSVYDASTGYHRAILIDQCISHFSEWWLYGSTRYGQWGYYLFDRTNHYVCLATDGGLLTLVLFVVIITRAFRSVGRVARAIEDEGRTGDAFLPWAMGASLLVHCVSFISATYFDQNMVNWYLLLALIASSNQLWVERSKRGARTTSRATRRRNAEVFRRDAVPA